MNKQDLKVNLTAIGNFEEKAIDLLEVVLKTTLETNKLFNLTAIKDEESFREKMIFDSALPLKNINLQHSNCIDVGTGAGFPGLVLSILNNAEIDLLDSTAKKINYLNNLKTTYNLKINGIVSRSEEYATKHREEYDFAFARAVSDLFILIEIIVPMLKVGGTLVAYKGPRYLDELVKAKSIMNKLGVELTNVQKEILPFSKEERNILYLKKTKVTSHQYPRAYHLIIK